jgi:probable blue pigment (indigoidine) exporter
MFLHRHLRGPLPALILAAAAWGLGTVISKRAVSEIPPLTLLAVQLGASVTALAVLMRWRGLPMRDPAAPPVLARLGLLNPGLAYALSLLGLAQVTASMSVLLWTFEPVLILLLAGIVLGERLGRSGILLSITAAGGMILVVAQPGMGGSLPGIVLTLAGVGCCAVYTIVSRRWLPAVEATAPIVLAQQVWALGFALVVVAGAVTLAGIRVLPETVSAAGWTSAIGSGVLYYGAAYWCYLAALRTMPASSAAAAFYLIPIFGLAGGFALLGERLTPLQWLGTVVVLVTVAALLRRGTASSIAPNHAEGVAAVAGHPGRDV